MQLSADASDERVVREGLLHGACATEFPLHRGVPEPLYRPAQHALLEAAGLERFAARMRSEGWDREMVRRLPNVEHGYWHV